MTHLERHVKPRVLEALADTRIVAIQGARQVGKTTLMQEIVAERGGRLVSYDDEQTLTLAQGNPMRFVAGLVLHTGATGGPFGERIAAVPIDVLWST